MALSTQVLADNADRPLPPMQMAANAPVSIIVFGTSLTANYDWPDVLGDRLGFCLQRSVSVTAVARAGQGSGWALSEGLAQIKEQAAADLIIAEFAINDADILDGVWLKDSRRQHDALIGQLRDVLAPGGGILLMTTNPVEGLVRHLQRPRLMGYYGLYPQLAETHDLGLADLTPRWQAAMAAADGSLFQDGLHPTQAAARAVIVPALAEQIATAFGHQGCTGRSG